jgi:hypothetical protein
MAESDDPTSLLLLGCFFWQISRSTMSVAKMREVLFGDSAAQKQSKATGVSKGPEFKL